MNSDKSLMVYAALWRASAEALCAGNPNRYNASYLSLPTTANWTMGNLPIENTKLTFASAVVAAIEQASVGFDKSGLYIDHKVDMRTAVFGGASLRDNFDQLNTQGSFAFCTIQYAAALEKTRYLLGLADGLQVGR